MPRRQSQAAKCRGLVKEEAINRALLRTTVSPPASAGSFFLRLEHSQLGACSLVLKAAIVKHHVVASLVRLTMHSRYIFTLASTFLVLLATGFGQSAAKSAQPQPVPAVDGELGACSVEFTTIDGNGNPIAGATVRLHLAYGFAGVRRLDLEVTTNTEGKARFTGLPDNLKKGLFFRGSKDDMEGTAFYEPKKNCKAQHTMVLEKPSTPREQ